MYFIFRIVYSSRRDDALLLHVYNVYFIFKLRLTYFYGMHKNTLLSEDWVLSLPYLYRIYKLHLFDVRSTTMQQ